MFLQIHRIVERSYVVGPGQRFCIWTQGCNRQCSGCMAPDTWNSKAGYQVSSDEIIESIYMMKAKGIEGITFLGGEPFLQAEALAVIAKDVKAMDLSVVTFTGYTLEELQKSDKRNYDALLSFTDLLIDGQFDINKMCLNRPWVGSSNQRYIFLTKRYSASDIEQAKNKIEIRIYPDGRTLVNGMGNFNQVQHLLN